MANYCRAGIKSLRGTPAICMYRDSNSITDFVTKSIFSSVINYNTNSLYWVSELCMLTYIENV
jgi:hypothetical protein